MLSGNNTVAPLEPICSTGTCDWSSYDTLAICAKTVDLSAQITKICQTIEYMYIKTGVLLYR